MTRITTSLAALSATAMLVVAAPAFARGNGGSGFGHASFSSLGSQSHLGSSKHEMTSNYLAKIKSSDFKSTSHADKQHNHRVSNMESRDHTIKHVDHGQKVDHKRREADSQQSSKPQLQRTTLVKKAPVALKLTDNQFSHAKLIDGKGRAYDALKKGWTDGKGHWWYGRFAWLFIDGDWYYGDARWTDADGYWSCENEMLIGCDNCKPVQSAEAVVADANRGSQQMQAVVTKVLRVPTEACPLDTSAVKEAALSSDTAASGNRVQPTSATVAPSQLRGIETGVAPVATTAVTTAAADTALVADGSTSPVECKRFLPNLSLTITVPCSQ